MSSRLMTDKPELVKHRAYGPVWVVTEDPSSLLTPSPPSIRSSSSSERTSQQNRQPPSSTPVVVRKLADTFLDTAGTTTSISSSTLLLSANFTSSVPDVLPISSFSIFSSSLSSVPSSSSSPSCCTCLPAGLSSCGCLVAVQLPEAERLIRPTGFMTIPLLSKEQLLRRQDWSMLDEPLSAMLAFALRKGKINVTDEKGQTCLMLAAQGGHTMLVRWLVEQAGAIVNKQCQGGWIALQLAVDRNQPELVQLLLQHGADVNHASLNGATSLMLAARRGGVQVLCCLLLAGARLHATSDNGWTAVMFAAFAGKNSALKKLLEAKAEVDTPDRDGATPLIIAAENGRLDVVQELLNAKARIDHQAADGTCAVSCAAHAGHVAVVRLLLSNGAPKDQQSTRGWTALMFAAIENRVEVMQLLVDEGFHREHAAHDGATALHVAALAGSAQALEILIGMKKESSNKTRDRDKEAAKPQQLVIHSLSTPGLTVQSDTKTNHHTSYNGSMISSSAEASIMIANRAGAEEMKSSSAHSSPEKQDQDVGDSGEAWGSKFIRRCRSAPVSPAKPKTNTSGSSNTSSRSSFCRSLSYNIQSGNTNNSLRNSDNNHVGSSTEEDRKQLPKVCLHLDLRSEQGWTPLMVASHERNKGAVQMLVKHRANVDIRSREGWSALMLAINAGDVSIVQTLLTASPDVYTPAADGMSALGLVSTQNADIAYALIKSGLVMPARCPTWWATDPAVCNAAEKALLYLHGPVFRQALLWDATASSEQAPLPGVLIDTVVQYAVPCLSEAMAWSKSNPLAPLNSSSRQLILGTSGPCVIS
eukprot:gb/GEZN01001192.1/.p1 GENE.gb/GEZN01001192.1/~~gb/GEZN01001192.1/.p1  ORF type:complete len:816 (+),score=140.56 gb/GEZN01001192.1/:94-2541(+)